MDRRRGWLKRDGWWRKEDDWGFRLKFSEETEKKFDEDDNTELQLQQVAQHVTHLKGFAEHEVGSAEFEVRISVLFDALELSKPSRLEHFILHDGTVTDADVAKLARAIESGCLQSLSTFEIHETEIGNGHVVLAKAMALGGLPSLKTLTLNCETLIDNELEAYGAALNSGKLPNLSSLRMYRNNVSGKGPKFWARAIWSGTFNKLAKLSLHGIGFGDEGLLALVDSLRVGAPGPLPNLSSLDLSWNGLTEVGLSAFGAALSSGLLPNLIYLDVGWNNIGDKGAKSLALAIRSGKLINLSELRLDRNSIGDDGVIALVDSFREGVPGPLPNLRSLDLASNGLTEVALSSLSSGFLPNLSHLRVDENNIGDKGAKSLALAIRSGKLINLGELRLGANGIGDEGVIALADSFREAGLVPNLSVLYLDINVFTEVGVLSLADALKSGRLNSLKLLVLHPFGHRPRSEKVLSALVSALLTNNILTVDVETTEWATYPALNRRKIQLLERNERNRNILAGLVTVPPVQATFGKVYLCGNPEVGKTTLRRTLQRSLRESLITWERRPHVEKRTRGIDVSPLSSKGNNPDENPITLLVWDMAGQEDFHVVHNAFFPDLGFAEGNATTFIVVCSSKHSLQDSMKQLEYWLRYIASSCDKSTENPRRVFVVVNKFRRDQKAHLHTEEWKEELELQRKRFEQHLKIEMDLFLVDVRKYRKVRGLKSRLLEHSRNSLRNQFVPDICHAIQENLSVLNQQREQFPVLHWTEFVAEVQRLKEPWPEDTILAATKYLNEAGVIIYIHTEGVRIVVVDPNWLCREILGRVFLPSHMASSSEGLFRRQVDPITGSISISNFKRFFKKPEWNEVQVDDLIAILLWLGLCYKGKEENIFLPALIAENESRGDPWRLQPQVDHLGDQWVMGFCVMHKRSEVALAPISLWHRFQVDLAQIPKFNGERPDSDFVADKYFVTFVADYMNVLIEVDANLDKPTFEAISILVKPCPVKPFETEELNAAERKQCQVDLADCLVERLLKLWYQVCPGVEYEQKVIWPWPASSSRPKDNPKRNVEIAELKKRVLECGMGRKMYWVVGAADPITEDQLLSTKDKRDVLQSMEQGVRILIEGVKDAVKLRIFPSTVLSDEEFSNESVVAADGIDVPACSIHEEQDEMCIKLSKLLDKKLKPIDNKVDKIDMKLGNVENLVREGFGEVVKKQKQLLHKLQDTEKMFLEDRRSICPKFIYLGTTDSAWVTVKDALSLSKTVRLHFACEAGYNNYRPHADVKNQQGLDVSQLRDWARTVLPWLKVSLTVLFITAKVAANVVAPGLGLMFPSFVDWQQTTTLSDGLALATGFSKDQLEQKIQETEIDANDAYGDPEGLYRASRKVISDLLGKLTPKEFGEKIGLRKVKLRYHDGTLHGIVWMCTDCFKEFPRELVSEL